MVFGFLKPFSRTINISSFPGNSTAFLWHLNHCLYGLYDSFLYNNPCMYSVLGTCNVWHSSRLFWFGRLPAPVLHLFAGPVWCGVNNIQTYTHTPSLAFIQGGNAGRPLCSEGGIWHGPNTPGKKSPSLPGPSCSLHLVFRRAHQTAFVFIQHILHGS